MTASWQTAVVLIKPEDDTQIVFETTRGSSHYGDVIIDNIRFKHEVNIQGDIFAETSDSVLLTQL